MAKKEISVMADIRQIVQKSGGGVIKVSVEIPAKEAGKIPLGQVNIVISEITQQMDL